jgi:hypothetical protein
MSMSTQDLCVLVQEAVKGAIGDNLQQTNSQVDKVDMTLASLYLDSEKHDKGLKVLRDDNQELRIKLSEFNANLDKIEQDNKRNNLIFTSVPVRMPANMIVAESNTSDPLALKTTKDLTKTIIDIICHVLNVPIEEHDICDIFHVITNQTPWRKTSVLVRFTRRSVRDLVFRSRVALKGLEINLHHFFVNEDLSTANHLIFRVLRQKFKAKKIMALWTRNCRIYCKTTEQRIVLVKSLAQANTVDR